MIQQNKVAFDFINYLTIEALEDGVSIMFTNDIEYGIDGCGWVYLPKKTYTPSLKSGQLISFRGELTPSYPWGIGTFTISKKCNLKGNCMSMLFGDNAANNFSLSDKNYAFFTLFEGCTNIISVSDDFLPATTLASQCYSRMFFSCTKLTTAPVLPATTLTNSCYLHMFDGCTKLNYIKMLATDISASNCLSTWVLGVASTGTFVKNPEANWDVVGINGVPEGWTVKFDGEEDSGNLISFTIGGTQYQAEEGMTWEEWVNSKYNIDMTFGIDEFEGTSIKNGASYVGTLTDYVKPSDLIIANYEYLLTW